MPQPAKLHPQNSEKAHKAPVLSTHSLEPRAASTPPQSINLQSLRQPDILRLQRTGGNHAVNQMLQTAPEQPLHGLRSTADIQQGTQPHIQRWGIKVAGGIGNLSGHETLTEVAMQDWVDSVKQKIAALEARAKGEKGEAKKNTQIEIKNLKEQLEANKEGMVAGSRWNDMLHNSTVAGLGMEIGKEGTLTNASHEGELQFLHSMAANMAEQAWQTQHKIMMWAEFCFKVSTGEIAFGTALENVQTTTETDFEGGPTFAGLFQPWGQQSVGWLFTGSTKPTDWPKAKPMAIGSMLHMLQDSFCMSHTQRVAAKNEEDKARLIKGFNVYTAQQGGVSGRHSKADVVQGGGLTSGKKRVEKTAGAQEAVDASAKVIGFWANGAPWTAVKEYLKGVLGLVPELEAQRPQNGQWPTEPTPNGGRIVSPSGRLFRQVLILDQFKQAFGRTSYFDPRAITVLRHALTLYNDELSKELKALTVAIDMDTRLELFLNPQMSAILRSLGAIPAALTAVDTGKKKPADKEQCKGTLRSIEAQLNQDQTEVAMDISGIYDAQIEQALK